MVRRAKRRRAGGPSYEEVKAQIDARERQKKLNNESKNRIEPVRQDIQSETSVDDRMELIMYALNDTVTPIPEEGDICTFRYFAKTPNLVYDQHPLVAVTELNSWGFRGINFHWGEYRQYTWPELGTQVYIVRQNELDDLLSLQYQKRVLNK